MMFLATLIGLLFTSVLIGVINTGIQDKIEDLRRGHSLVIERGHTVILGFDDTTFTIIGQLVLANENRKDAAVVVLGPGEKAEMEEAIRRQVPDRKTTRIICRSGETDSIADLEMCAVHRADGQYDKHARISGFRPNGKCMTPEKMGPGLCRG